jgi:hypothetical protein
VQIAIDTWFREEGLFQNRMRAALDAAIQAQGIGTPDQHSAHFAYEQGRAEALEEAAKLPVMSDAHAAQIRALKDK